MSDIDQFLITIKQAATRYEISARTIRRWIADGRLRKYTRQGDRALRIDCRELARLREWREGVD